MIFREILQLHRMKIIELIFYLTALKYLKKIKKFKYRRIAKFDKNIDF